MDTTTSAQPTLQQLIKPNNKSLCILGFDPGGTTGYTLYNGKSVTDVPNFDSNQYRIPRVDTQVGMTEFIARTHRLIASLNRPGMQGLVDLILIEDYRIYSSKLDEHTNSNVPTAQQIGVIMALAHTWGKRVKLQSASQGKAFVTDDKLKASGLYQPRLPHAMDSLRHVLHYLIFN